MNKTKKYSALEKTIFIGGLLILISLLGYLSFQSLRHKTSPPDLKISMHQRSDLPHTTFSVKVKNQGSSTAAAVNIQFDLFQHGKSVSTATITMDYVPVHSEKNAWLVFYHQQKYFDSLVVSSVSYNQP